MNLLLTPLWLKDVMQSYILLTILYLIKQTGDGNNENHEMLYDPTRGS